MAKGGIRRQRSLPRDRSGNTARWSNKPPVGKHCLARHGKSLGSHSIDYRGRIDGPRAVVRYADDFVVFCESKEDAEQAKNTLKGWLDNRGLTLSEEKTQIVHLTEGFDFLGFNIRHYKAPLTSKSGFKLLIKPSKKSVTDNTKEKCEKIWLRGRGANVPALLTKLNPIIRGWANYFRIGVARETFTKLDNWMYHRELRYASRTHPNKPWHWKTKTVLGKAEPKKGRSLGVW